MATMDRPLHAQRLWSCTWADLYPCGDASCGLVSACCCRSDLVEERPGVPWRLFGILPRTVVVDGLNGSVARRWGRHSPVGAAPDFLADIIAFGVAPGRPRAPG